MHIYHFIMEQLTDDILKMYGTLKDNHYCIWAPDLKFRLYIKRGFFLFENFKFQLFYFLVKQNNKHI